MRTHELQQAGSGVLEGILITARPAVKDDMRSHVRLKVPAPRETKDLSEIV
jgi:hypothetical protein